MADDSCSIVFVFIYELLSSGESNLIDILIHLLGCHTNTTVGNGKRTLLLINRDAHFQVAQFVFKFTYGSQRLQFLRGIYCVAHKFTKENLVVAIQKFLDYRKNVGARNTDITLCHIIVFIMINRYTAIFL